MIMQMTKRYLPTFALMLVVSMLTIPGSAMAVKSDMCANCHGLDGNASSSVYPSLAGQTREYLYRQLKDFKEGRRKNPQMTTAVAILTDQDMHELADYYAGEILKRKSFQPDPELVEKGKKIAQEAKCASCHQSGYGGLNEFPRLTRQSRLYTVSQLKAFRDGVRTNDNGVMAPWVKNMTDAQIEALSHYLSSL